MYNIGRRINKKTCIILGAGPSLDDVVDFLAKEKTKKFIIAANGAITPLISKGKLPNLIVTDLDGAFEDLLKANMSGVPLMVHAHGDNMDRIGTLVPRFTNVIGTTQGIPFGKLHNFGGFTDGDRAFMLASHFNADPIILGGMDFGDIVTPYSKPELKSNSKADPIKRKKLQWARRLIEYEVKKRNLRVYNISQGEKIEGTMDIKISDLDKILKSLD
ncbi:MAG: 6-hydroxymethylpterin diphosphokinase MptE-like protein [Candidatus Hydrothermarchaeota archaeon]